MSVLLIGPTADRRRYGMFPSGVGSGASARVSDPRGEYIRGVESSSLWRNAFVSMKVLLQVLLNAARVDVISFHASDRGMVAFGPILFVIARLWRKRLIVRLFGGSFDRDFAARGGLMQRIIRRSVLASDVCLFQTKSLVRSSPSAGASVVSNTRWNRAARLHSAGGRQCERLVFAGHMWVTKGGASCFKRCRCCRLR
jgi:hypothetical protein